MQDKLHTKAYVTKKNGRMVAVASEEVADREGDVISLNGWQLNNFKANPVLLWYHNVRERSLPIGKAENIRKGTVNGQRKLLFDPVFETITEFGRTVKEMFDQGFLNSFSVGFIPLDRDGVNITKQELLEISAVPVPALPSAQIISRSVDLGLNEETVKAILGDEEAQKAMTDDMGKKELGTENAKEIVEKEGEIVEEDGEDAVETDEPLRVAIKELMKELKEDNKKEIEARNKNSLKALKTLLAQVISSLENPTKEEVK